ncbi:hypothetical protein [Isoptericola sp. NPDC057191]|uniref:hypothetical protein n=1 Tax=Isoptericola sp. NPDC057191 TaxID=3346041 RepID=UPI0036382D5D
MTSATTSKGKTTTRLAAVSLLAVTMMLGACSAPTEDVQSFIAGAKSQAEAIDVDLQQLQHATGVPAALRGPVTDAISSAQAATDEARAALARAATSADGAVVALEDAQVALEAASAEVRYVTDAARQKGAGDVADQLSRLQEQIDALRGETESAVA